MPNTLAHLGVGGLVTRVLIRDADPKWIYAGCVIPDAPWILQRLVCTLPLDVDPYDLRLYCIAQSSFLLCLVLAAALSVIAQAPRRVFAILALNALLHLLLDACQTKWGNGVHVLAPASWRLWEFSFFWPESFTSCALTVFGLAYVVVVWQHGRAMPMGLTFQPYRRIVLAAVLIAVYFMAPFVLLPGAEHADNHFIRTLRDSADRTGRYVELDRTHYVHRKDGDFVSGYAGEELGVVGVDRNRPGSVSVRGVFIDNKTILILEMHDHWNRIRDYVALIGLGIVTLYWLKPCLGLLQRRSIANAT